MKTIEYISFTQTILIPAKDKFKMNSHLSFYAGVITGHSEKSSKRTDVMLFNCESASEIESIIDKEIARYTIEIKDKGNITLKKLEEGKKFFEGLKRDINTSEALKKAEDDLIEIVSKECRLYEIEKDNIILISGIDQIIEK